MNDSILEEVGLSPRPVEPTRGALLVVAIALCLLLAVGMAGFRVLGFNASGWGWVGGYLAAALTLLAPGRLSRTFPIGFWLPWIIWLCLRAAAPHDYAIQSTAQILCPLAVGYAASTLRPSTSDVRLILSLLRATALGFCVVLVVIRLPVLLAGVLPTVTGLAAEATSALCFQALFLCLFTLFGLKRDLFLYLLVAAVPITAVTRGPILGSLGLVFLAVAPIRFWSRFWVSVLAVSVATGLFYTERFQKKTFWSGEGTLAEFLRGGDDVVFSGRDVMRDLMVEGIREEPWLGKGANATLSMLREAGIELEQPHNDWLRIVYNYGVLGLVFYAGAVLLCSWHAWRTARGLPPATQSLFYAGISAFIPYAILMLLDNVLVYSQYFGNLQFLMLGLGYGSARAAEEAAERGYLSGPY